MIDKFTERIRQTTREILTNISLAKVDIRSSREKRRDRSIEPKERVEAILKKSKARGEIADFLSTFLSTNGHKETKRQRYWLAADFLITLVKRGRYLPVRLKVKGSRRGAEKYLERETRRRERFGGGPMKTLVLVAETQKSDEQLEKDWQEILTRFLKS